MTTLPVSLRLSVDGAEQAQRQMGGFNATLADSQRQLTESSNRAGQAASAIGNFSAVVGQTSPRMAAFSGVIGQVGGAVSALSTSMGPLGVALAAVTAAVGAYTLMAQRQREVLEAQRAEVDRLGTSYVTLAGRMRSAIDAQVALDRIRAGQGSSIETAARAEELNNRLQIMQRALAGDGEAADALRREGVTGEREGANRGLVRSAAGVIVGDRAAGVGALTEGEIGAVSAAMQATRRELVRTTEALEVATERTRVETSRIVQEGENAEAGITPRSRGGGGGAANEARAAFERDQQMREASWREEVAFAARRAELEQANADEISQVRVRLAQFTHELDVEQAEAQRAALAERTQREKEAQRELAEANMQKLQDQKDAQNEAIEELKSDSLPLLQGAVSGLTSALSSVIAGTKSADEAFAGMLSSFLEMISQQAALEAAKEFAAAIGSFASQDYGGGALHIAAGVAWTGVAVAAGAASVAVAPPAESAPASPQSGGGGEGGGGSSYTFNINGTVLSSGSRANLGRELSSVIGEGDRRFGRTG